MPPCNECQKQAVKPQQSYGQLSQEEESNLNEIQKYADCKCASGEILDKVEAVVAEREAMEIESVRNRITVVVGVLRNQTQGKLQVLYSMKWAGHIVKNYPNPLNIGMGVFGQGALSFKGVEAAVVYTGKNRAGVECAWLVAWADTKALGQRIYAKCGAKEKFNCIDWNEVRKELENGGAVIKARDPDTATTIYAGMAGYKDKDVMAAAICG